MQTSDLQRIMHMRAYCEAVTGYLERNNYSRDAFSSDRMFFDAVSMCVLQIGELAKSLSDEFLSDHPELPSVPESADQMRPEPHLLRSVLHSVHSAPN